MTATFLASAVAAGAACIDNQWDPDYAWVKDCSPNQAYDGWFSSGVATTSFSGEVKVPVGTVTRTLSWRLHFYGSPLPGASAIKDSLPLILGLHSWTEGKTIDQLLESEPSLMEYEGAWESVIYLSVALETGNNLNTWWDGSKVDGAPEMWATNAIVALVRERIKDACGLLAAAGSAALLGKVIDANRVYARGHSMGGTGTYHIGVKYPDIFAAIHAHAGFADYDGGPCGNENFCLSFTRDYIGTEEENLQMKGIDGKPYAARKYSNMSWFAGEHKGASWTAGPGNGRKYEPPYVNITHGSADDAVSISSADRFHAVLKARRYGYSYLRHPGGHSNENFARLNWLLGFRKNRSYLAFTDNSTDVAGSRSTYNDLDKVGWMTPSILDEPHQYRVTLVGQGTADITPRRLQRFVVEPGKTYHWRLNDPNGTPKSVVADSEGTITLPGVVINGNTILYINPGGVSGTLKDKGRKKTPAPRFVGDHFVHPVPGSVGGSLHVNGLGRAVPPLR